VHPLQTTTTDGQTDRRQPYQKLDRYLVRWAKNCVWRTL